MNRALEMATSFSSRLPRYARLIALNSAHERLQLILQRPGSITIEEVQRIYRLAVANVFKNEFRLTDEEAASDEEFIDFYLRHGVLTAKLADTLFAYIIVIARDSSPETMEDNLSGPINAMLELVDANNGQVPD